MQNAHAWIKPKVLRRARKASCKNKHWYDIQRDVNKENRSVNLEQVQRQLIIDDLAVNLVMKIIVLMMKP